MSLVCLNSPNHPPVDASYLDNSQEITRGGAVCFCAKTEKKTKMTLWKGTAKHVQMAWREWIRNARGGWYSRDFSHTPWQTRLHRQVVSVGTHRYVAPPPRTFVPSEKGKHSLSAYVSPFRYILIISHDDSHTINTRKCPIQTNLG